MVINTDARNKQSTAGKIGISIFFFVFFAMGTVFEILTFKSFTETMATYSWKQVLCVISESKIKENFSDESPFSFDVSYIYEYENQEYAGKVYKLNYSGTHDYTKVLKLIAEYPEGSKRSCYIDPKNPGRAVLKRENLLGKFLLLFFPMIFIAIGAGGIFFTWRKKKTGAEPLAAKAKGNRKKEKLFLGLLFSIFGIVGAGMLYPLSIRPIIKTIEARSWQETPCKIISARVRSHDGDDSTTYSVDILYQYKFKGKIYKSNKYDFIGGSSSGYNGKAEAVQKYQNARNPVCYVNPDDPGEAVLKRNFGLEHLFCLFPLPFLAIGVGGLTWVARGQRRKSAIESWAPEIKAETAGISPYIQPGDIHYGPVVLKAKYSPWIKFIGTIAVAAFWNGIVSIFLVDVIKGFKSGEPSWLLTIFMIPFVVIGIGMIGYIFYQLLACSNPRPELIISSGSIPLGESAELQWRFSGRVNIIRKLKITLKGTEEATYRRGTDTVTDKKTFYEMELIQTENSNTITTGQLGLVVPDDTMHSFEAKNNKIIWSIELHGDIKSWPDVKESFKINVTPTAK